MAEEKDGDDLKEFTGGSKSFREKANAIVKAVRKLIGDRRKGKRSAIVIYLETDSIPIAVEIDATVLEEATADPFPPNVA